MALSLTDTPLALGEDLILKNRVVMAPLTRGRCGRDQVPKSHSAVYYSQRSSAGLIISEATVISEQGMGWSGAAAIYKPEHVAGWKTAIEAVHKSGGKIFCQLWHMGRVTHTDFHGLTPIAPSAIAAEGNAWIYNKVKKPYEVPRALESHEIPSVIEEYRHAASLAKEAGFDGVEIHSANGYLLDQFLQSSTNIRTDEYGGSKEARFVLLKQVLEAVGTVWPYNRIAVRLSPNGSFGSMGSADNNETFTYAISELNKYPLAFLHLVDGLAFGFHGKCDVFRAHQARCLFDKPIIGNCGYTKEQAEGAINTGCLDAVSFGRPYIANPDLVERFRNSYPLAPLPDFSLWYEAPGDSEDPDSQSVGYSDYPAYTA